MAIYITDECVACGACEDECPNTAISLADPIFVIDPSMCTECVGFYDTPSCQEACPVDCCLPDPERTETEPVLFARAKEIHPGELDTIELGPATSHFRVGV